MKILTVAKLKDEKLVNLGIGGSVDGGGEISNYTINWKNSDYSHKDCLNVIGF